MNIDSLQLKFPVDLIIFILNIFWNVFPHLSKFQNLGKQFGNSRFCQQKYIWLVLDITRIYLDFLDAICANLILSFIGDKIRKYRISIWLKADMNLQSAHTFTLELRSHTHDSWLTLPCLLLMSYYGTCIRSEILKAGI